MEVPLAADWAGYEKWNRLLWSVVLLMLPSGSVLFLVTGAYSFIANMISRSNNTGGLGANHSNAYPLT
jgi:hypothetical protein